MPDAVIVELAEAVRGEIEGGLSFDEDFVVERSYVPIHTVEELETLTISVVPTELSAELVDRSRKYTFDYTIDVGIQKRVDDTNVARDAIVKVIEDITDIFRGRAFAFGASGQEARCLAFEVAALFDPDQLDEQRVFTSVVTFAFRVLRATTNVIGGAGTSTTGSGYGDPGSVAGYGVGGYGY